MLTITDDMWAANHIARADLRDDLPQLEPDDWFRTTLCATWDVNHVVAHMTATASTTQGQWIRSMMLSGFRPPVHNERRLTPFLGTDGAKTLATFSSVVDARIAASKDLS